MFLGDLLKSIEKKYQKIPVKGISFDSRKVKTGDIFFAISGDIDNGNLYINEAILNGAGGIVSENKESLRVSDKNVQTFLVKNSRNSYAHACVEFFSRPSSDLQVCGITGTNGKTSVAHLLKEIWKKQNSGLIGTIETNFAGKKIPSSLTTPDSYQLNKFLKEMTRKKVKRVFMMFLRRSFTSLSGNKPLRSVSASGNNSFKSIVFLSKSYNSFSQSTSFANKPLSKTIIIIINT